MATPREGTDEQPTTTLNSLVLIAAFIVVGWTKNWKTVYPGHQSIPLLSLQMRTAVLTDFNFLNKFIFKYKLSEWNCTQIKAFHIEGEKQLNCITKEAP